MTIAFGVLIFLVGVQIGIVLGLTLAERAHRQRHNGPWRGESQ